MFFRIIIFQNVSYEYTIFFSAWTRQQIFSSLIIHIKTNFLALSLDTITRIYVEKNSILFCRRTWYNSIGNWKKKNTYNITSFFFSPSTIADRCRFSIHRFNESTRMILNMILSTVFNIILIVSVSLRS